MARKSTTAAPARRNLTAKVRNQITELADEGKTVAAIASECGISEAKVEATLAAAAEGKTLGEAAAAALAAGATAEEAIAADPTVKPAKPAKVARVTREATHTSTGVRLFGVLPGEGPDDNAVQDLGAWGANDFQGAVDAYEAANPEGKFTLGYLGCPMRNVWHVASGASE